ncbi:MAG: nitrite reductase, partial [Rhodospirillales bacterium]|nr:nitrite reductase [Rhodospirillales bacterium]
VVDIRAVEVTREGGGLFPVAHREQIRARGPSVRADLPAGVWRDGNEPLPPLPSASSSSPFAGIYRYDEYDRDFLRQRAAIFGEQVERRRKGELSEEEFKPLRLMNGLYLQLHAYMLRIAIPYGVLSATQLRQLAYVARHYDRGYGHFTTRQNIQFNWLRLEDTPAALAALAEADIHGIQTSGNCIRNTTTDEFAGAAADEIVDPRLYAEIIRQWSTDHPEFTYLPRKFKIAIVGAGHDRAAVRVHDIGIEAYRNTAGAPVFRIFAGGGLGRTPYVAVQLREDLPVAELLRYCEAILRVYNALGRRDNMYKARIKILIREMKPEAFLKMVEDEYASLPEDYCTLTDEMVQAVAARFPVPEFPRQDTGVLKSALLDDRALARWVKQNTHPHKQPGYISAVISLKPVGGIAGDASADEMDVVADLADKYSLGEIRVSHVQNLVLPHVAKDDL